MRPFTYISQDLKLNQSNVLTSKKSPRSLTAVFLALHKSYTDSRSRITFAEPGRLGLPLDCFFGGVNCSNNVFHRPTCKNWKLFTDMDTAIVCCSRTSQDGTLKALNRKMEEDIKAIPIPIRRPLNLDPLLHPFWIPSGPLLNPFLGQDDW